VGARAPFDRGRLVTVEALSKSAKELLHGSRLYLVGSEGSMPPPEGIPLSTPPLALNMSEGISRKWLKPWPCMGPLLRHPLLCLLEGSYRTPVEADFRSLKVYRGLRAHCSFAWKCPSVGLPSRPLGCIFLGGK
jgi:hypothetical protein